MVEFPFTAASPNHTIWPQPTPELHHFRLTRMFNAPKTSKALKYTPLNSVLRQIAKLDFRNGTDDKSATVWILVNLLYMRLRSDVYVLHCCSMSCLMKPACLMLPHCCLVAMVNTMAIPGLKQNFRVKYLSKFDDSGFQIIILFENVKQ